MEPEVQPELTRFSLSSYWRIVQQNRNFRRLWIAQIVSEIGDWFYTLAIYTLLLQLTGRASSVAFALVLQVLPHTFMSATSGVVNDRISRKRVMIMADLARMVIVASMLFVRSASMVWLIYPLLLLETLMVSFFEPARTSVIPNIASREDLVLANTISSTTWSINLVLGAAIGGVVGAFLGRDAVFILNALSFLLSAFFISRMRFKEPHVTSAPFRASELVDFSPVLDGIRYIRRERKLLLTVFVKAGLFVIGPSWIVFTVMGQREFPLHWNGLNPQRGAMLGMSLLMAARGVGALLGPFLTAHWAAHYERRLRLGILFGFLAESLGYAALGISSRLWMACLFVIIAHFGGSIIWVFSTTLLQLGSEDRFRGRVFATELAFSMLTIAVGAYLAGFFIDHDTSARQVAAIAGLLMLIPTAIWAWVLARSNSHLQSRRAEAAD
jgi:MFS family permease